MVTNSKEYMSKYMKDYYDKNKEMMKETVKTKVLCEICNCYVTKCKLQRHLDTNKHILKVNNLK